MTSARSWGEVAGGIQAEGCTGTGRERWRKQKKLLQQGKLDAATLFKLLQVDTRRVVENWK